MEGLKRQGLSIQAISELTGYDRKTVRKYLLAPDGVPAYGRRKVKPGKRYTTGRAAADMAADRLAESQSTDPSRSSSERILA